MYNRHIRASYDIKNEASFPVINNKKNKSSLNKKVSDSNTTSVTASITNDDSTIVSSFSHDDFLKMLDKNTTFKEDIEDSFNEEVVEKLQLNNNVMIETISNVLYRYKV